MPAFVLSMEILGVQYQWYPLQQQAAMPNMKVSHYSLCQQHRLRLVAPKCGGPKLAQGQPCSRQITVLLPRWLLTTSQRYLVTGQSKHQKDS
ncbi:hypothetical protein SS50377_21283 [Spironucleus salmonicida]|nr:hypothetical protein SS50377_21283 [Spironucleus salmonicida]